MDAFFEEFKHLRIQLEDIKSATDNFDDKRIIGTGGFGKVYEGELSHFKGRSMVAFKRLDRRFGQGNSEFWKEIMMLSRYTHKNLISLLGFCDQDGEKILIYEHASNRSLYCHLRSTTFTWIERLKICLDAARGLSYLHDDKGTHQRVLHRDIKSSNILLDDNWNAKVSDMGLSKIGPANQEHTTLITNVAGTIGYLDPTYMEFGILTKESDVYSFGVVLFEVLCGRLCFENNNGDFPSLVRIWKQKCKHKKLDEIMFQNLIQEMDERSLETYSDIALRCLHKYRIERPTMSLVVEKLETALEFQEIYEQMKCTLDYKKIIETAVHHSLDYKKIIETAVHPMTYKSEEELKSCLSKGILVNGGKTWFILNKNGEHCEMISARDCLVQDVGSSSSPQYLFDRSSRFSPLAKCYLTGNGIFKAHIRTQFLSPQTPYAVNIVFKRLCKALPSTEPSYSGIEYRLEGETVSSLSCLAIVREDGWLMAELYQFENQTGNVDLKISFLGTMCYSYCYLFEGIEFRPIEKVEHKVLDGMQYWEKNLPNDYEDIIRWSKDGVKWTTKKELYSTLCKGFLMSNGQVWFFLAKSGKRCLMLPARKALIQGQWKWESRSESRFGEVAFDGTGYFSISCKVKSQILSPETTYACYLVYKLSKEPSQSLYDFQFPMKVHDGNFHDGMDRKVLFHNVRFIYLLNPQTPVIGPKVNQKSHNSLNWPGLKGIPRQRDDGWMEVQVCEFQPGTSIEPKLMCVELSTFLSKSLRGLTVQGIEFRPE